MNDSFQILDQGNNKGKNNLQFKVKSKFKRFVGPYARSKHGCLNCKRRKKKCDEIHPICGSCDKRGDKCHWKDKEGVKEPTSIQAIVTYSSHNILESVEYNKSIKNNKNNNRLFQSSDVPSNVFNFHYKTGFELGKFSVETQINQVYDKYMTDILYINMKISSPFQFLDHEAIMYFRYWIFSKHTLTTSKSSTSSLLEVFLRLAIQSNAILYAIISWGCLFFEKSASSEKKSLEYMKRAKKLLESEKSFHMKQDISVYILATFYLIQIGREIISGDVLNWYDYFTDCKNLIQKNGGLKSLCTKYDTTDMRLILSEFQYHDILSSATLIDGTTYPMDLYEDMLFDIRNQLDRFQATLLPIYLILGEIKNRYVISKEDETLLLSKSNNLVHNREQILLLRRKRSEYNEICEHYYKYFEEKLDSCIPYKEQLQILIEDTKEFEYHMLMFELNVLVCKLYLEIYYRKTPPSSLVQQNFLMQCLDRIDILMDTDLAISIGMPLFICGITCCESLDRKDMLLRFDIVIKKYGRGNVRRMRDVLQECWKTSPEGKQRVDWPLIVANRGQYLFVGHI